MIIAIDGFSSVGKSSVSLEVAKRLGIIHLNSGAIYRAIGVFCENSKINPSEITYEDCVNSKIELTFFAGKQQTLLNKEDVSLKIKDKKYSHLASVVGNVFVVHEYINEIIRKFTQNKSIVADGRDMGTNVFPDANFKFFLTATAGERAKRRWNEFLSYGKEIAFDEVLSSIKERDNFDLTREVCPLLIAEDAITIDTTNLSFNEVVDLIISYIK